MCRLIGEAGFVGADVVSFLECIILGHAGWREPIPAGHGKACSLFLKLWDNSVEVPEPEADAIGAAC